MEYTSASQAGGEVRLRRKLDSVVVLVEAEVRKSERGFGGGLEACWPNKVLVLTCPRAVVLT